MRQIIAIRHLIRVILMQYHTDGIIFKVANISGPTHNFLGLEFCECDDGELIIESITLNSKEPVRLNSIDVQREVMKGLEKANQEFGTNYRLKRIQFAVSDTAPVEIYTQLVQNIVARLRSHPNDYNGHNK
jgi:hypothetical protein